MKRLTLFTILAMVLISQSVVTTLSEDNPASKSDTFSVQSMKTEDQVKVNDLFKQVNDLQKDVELAQTKIELAQAKMARINEVQIPGLIAQIRKDYKKPEAEWDFDLRSFTFTKRTGAVQDKK